MNIKDRKKLQEEELAKLLADPENQAMLKRIEKRSEGEKHIAETLNPVLKNYTKDLSFNADELDWGKPIEPKYSKKGPYFLSNKIPQDSWQIKEIRAKLSEEVNKGGHSVLLDGSKYWHDFRSKVIARRIVTENQN